MGVNNSRFLDLKCRCFCLIHILIFYFFSWSLLCIPNPFSVRVEKVWVCMKSFIAIWSKDLHLDVEHHFFLRRGTTLAKILR
jgi:hypothetical protein